MNDISTDWLEALNLAIGEVHISYDGLVIKRVGDEEYNITKPDNNSLASEAEIV